MEDAKEKANWRTFVFIHKNFMQQLRFKKENVFEEVIIGDEKFYYFSNSIGMKTQNYYPLETEARKFVIKKPNLVQILSPNVCKTIFNGAYLDILKQFNVKSSEIGEYLHRNFIHHDFINLTNDHNTSLSVEIVDENSNLLHLRPGFPSYVKLVFKSENMPADFIRISSVPTELYPSNSLANFSVELPRTLNYTYKKDPKVALTSVTLENDWKIRF